MTSDNLKSHPNEMKRKISDDKLTIINDIVHGLIELPPYILSIIDSREFQRLRHVKQLSMCTFVYPSSGYSRFEHSIGTFHLASKLMKYLQTELRRDYDEKDCKEIITENDIKCVEIAALCHDLGHGCYSHFWEHAFDEKVKTKPHEELSVEILMDLLENKKKQIGLDQNMINLIGRIIKGHYEKSIDGKKKYLFEIVANKESGLDVDKFDYLCRDQIYLGWSNKNKIHDIKRILHFFRVVNHQIRVSDGVTKIVQGNWHLAIRDREIFHIHNIFYTRHLLHRYGYQHKTVMAISYMFKNALKIICRDFPNEFIENVMGKLKDDENVKGIENLNKKRVVTVNGKRTKTKNGERVEISEDNETENVKEEEVKVIVKGELIPLNDIWFSKEFISQVRDDHLYDVMCKYTTEIVENVEERNIYKYYCKFRVDSKDKNKIEELRSEIIKFQSTVNKDIEILQKIDNFNKKLDPVAFELSTFALQSENLGDPLLKVKFYKKSDMKTSFNYTESNLSNPLPDMVKLIDNETIMMIFVYKSISKEDFLFKIKEKLCKENTENNLHENINEKIVELKKKYAFTEINY